MLELSRCTCAGLLVRQLRDKQHTMPICPGVYACDFTGFNHCVRAQVHAFPEDVPPPLEQLPRHSLTTAHGNRTMCNGSLQGPMHALVLYTMTIMPSALHITGLSHLSRPSSPASTAITTATMPFCSRTTASSFPATITSTINHHVT